MPIVTRVVIMRGHTGHRHRPSIQYVGWTGKDGSPSPTLGTIIKKSYNGSL